MTCTAVTGVYLAERINSFLGKHWKSFASQNYFDPHGLFISVLWSGPLLLVTIVIVVGYPSSCSILYLIMLFMFHLKLSPVSRWILFSHCAILLWNGKRQNSDIGLGLLGTSRNDQPLCFLLWQCLFFEMKKARLISFDTWFYSDLVLSKLDLLDHLSSGVLWRSDLKSTGGG